MSGDLPQLLRVNASSRPNVAMLDLEELDRLLMLEAVVLIADCMGAFAGYLIAFSDQAPYDGEEFRYCQMHIQLPFFYIDQVAVSPDYRLLGAARTLYNAAFVHPALSSSLVQCCEVNIDPPNPESMAFHTSMGFERLTSLRVQDGRTVALLVKHA